MDLPESPYYTERKYRSYRDKFTFPWMVFRDCNFDCAYCAKTDEKPISFNVDEFIEAAAKVFPGPYRIAITGGEPLMMPWMIELCRKIGEAGNSIEMQTNFSINAREFVDNMDPSYIDIIETSFHPDARVRWRSRAIEKFVENFLYARGKGFNITTWLIDDPRIGVAPFMSDCEWLCEHGIVPIRKRYMGDEGGGGVGDAIWVQGKMCIAGYRGVCMWENFDITVCDHDRTVLGNLFTGVDLYGGPSPCNKPFCGCLGREWLVDKFHDDFYGQEFGGPYESD